jgi:hypothetical protein
LESTKLDVISFKAIGDISQVNISVSLLDDFVINNQFTLNMDLAFESVYSFVIYLGWRSTTKMI